MASRACNTRLLKNFHIPQNKKLVLRMLSHRRDVRTSKFCDKQKENNRTLFRIWAKVIYGFDVGQRKFGTLLCTFACVPLAQKPGGHLLHKLSEMKSIQQELHHFIIILFLIYITTGYFYIFALAMGGFLSFLPTQNWRSFNKTLRSVHSNLCIHPSPTNLEIVSLNKTFCMQVLYR